MVIGKNLSYAAAVIDCDGSIQIGSHPSPHNGGGYSCCRLVVNVNMTTERIPRWLHDTFGGGFGIYKNKIENTKPFIYTWYKYSVGAMDFIKLILPYLKLKKTQAEIGIEFQESKLSRQGRKTSEKELKKQNRLYTKMKELNRRGSV